MKHTNLSLLLGTMLTLNLAILPVVLPASAQSTSTTDTSTTHAARDTSLRGHGSIPWGLLGLLGLFGLMGLGNKSGRNLES